MFRKRIATRIKKRAIAINLFGIAYGMRYAGITRNLLAAALLLGAALLSTVLVPTAHGLDDCYANHPGWWPLCEIGVPSIPRYNYGAPRPPLTPKDSPWCTQSHIWVNGGKYIRLSNGTGVYAVWCLTAHDKIAIRFWPDYYRNTYTFMYWDPAVGQWKTINDYRNQTSTFCDA